MKIRVAYHDIQPNGYGEFARVFIDALQRESTHQVLTDKLVPGHKKSPASRTAEINVVVTTPEHFQGQVLPGAKNLGYTMWESSHIRPDWARACNLMHGILVPAIQSKEILIRSGVTAPIHIVPPCVGTYPPKAHSGVFTFLSVFQWGDRKDPASLLRAYWQEFKPNENVKLVIKTWPFFGETNQRILADIQTIRGELPHETPKLEVLTRFMNRTEILNLHAMADCYVSSHHGEGWSLPLMDAMASGTPCVATRYGGNLAFMNDLNSLLVDYTELPAAPRNSWLKSVYAGSTWAQINIADLRRKMRAVFESQHGESLLGQLAQHDMRAFTPTLTTRAFNTAIHGVPRSP